MQRRQVVLAAIGVMGVLTSAWAQPAGFPAKPIQLIVPFGAGGSTDVIARAVARGVEKELGQPVLVVNKAGAGGAIAFEEVRRAPADGHTLLLFGASGATVTPFMQKVTYDSRRDFAPVMAFGGYTTYLVVPSDSPFKTYADLAKHIRSNPNQVVMGVTALGAAGHLAAARLMKEQELKVDFMALSSGAQVITNLLGKHIQVASVAGEITPLVKEGKLRALLSFTRNQAENMKDVPSIQQIGASWELDSWLGIAAPAGTPEPVRAKLEEAFIKAAGTPEFEKVMSNMAMLTSIGGSEKLRKQLESAYSENGRIIKELGLGK